MKAKNGNNYGDIKKILNKYRFLKLVLDTSHIRQIKECYASEPNITEYWREFSKKVVEIQVSNNMNCYKNIFKKKFKTNHSLLCLRKNSIIPELKKINFFSKTNLTIEGVIPFCNLGEQLLIKEINLFRKIATSN